MKAAAAAAERGHQVTLYEKSARLGGQELLCDRGAGVFRPGGLGQLLIGDDPGLRVGGHMDAVAVF